MKARGRQTNLKHRRRSLKTSSFSPLGQRIDADNILIPTGDVLANQPGSVNDFWSAPKVIGANITAPALEGNCGNGCTGYGEFFLSWCSSPLIQPALSLTTSFFLPSHPTSLHNELRNGVYQLTYITKTHATSSTAPPPAPTTGAPTAGGSRSCTRRGRASSWTCTRTRRRSSSTAATAWTARWRSSAHRGCSTTLRSRGRSQNTGVWCSRSRIGSMLSISPNGGGISARSLARAMTRMCCRLVIGLVLMSRDDGCEFLRDESFLITTHPVHIS